MTSKRNCYNVFYSTRRAELLALGMSSVGADALPRREWREMSEEKKEVWRKKASELVPVVVPKYVPVKKPLTGYMLYTKCHPKRGKFVEIAEDWKKLSKEEKDVWTTHARSGGNPCSPSTSFF